MTLPPLSEADFLKQVVQLAEIRRWQWLHLRPGMTRDSWRTPVSGPLGKGWPDIVAGRVKDRRRLAIELKRDGGSPTAEQVAVLAFLEAIGFEAFVWRPSDWDEIEQVLR